VNRSPLLQVEDLSLTFRTVDGPSRVLDGISFTVDAGERLALVGESGCGKSATVRTILGLNNPRTAFETGAIRFAGQPLLENGGRAVEKLRGERIALIVQDPVASLNPMFTIGNQMDAIIRRKGLARSASAARRIAREALAAVSISDPERLLSAYPHQISGGQAQRVIIASALLGNPELLLADEPGTALDVTVQAQTLRLMEDLAARSGTAILLITHNLGVVREFADRVCVMYAGQIVESASVADLFSSPLHPYTRALLDAVPRLGEGSRLKAIDGSVPNLTEAPSGCRFRTRCPSAMPHCAQPAPRTDVGNKHEVACWLFADRRDTQRAQP